VGHVCAPDQANVSRRHQIHEISAISMLLFAQLEKLLVTSHGARQKLLIVVLDMIDWIHELEEVHVDISRRCNMPT
jgi:hypothetical protein